MTEKQSNASPHRCCRMTWMQLRKRVESLGHRNNMQVIVVGDDLMARGKAAREISFKECWKKIIVAFPKKIVASVRNKFSSSKNIVVLKQRFLKTNRKLHPIILVLSKFQKYPASRDLRPRRSHARVVWKEFFRRNYARSHE